MVATIKPIHSLVAAIMAGAGTPALLIQGTESEHAYALRPSGATVIDQSRLVFWIGPKLETFLERPLAALAGKATIVSLAEAEGVRLLRIRDGGSWAHEPGHEHDGRARHGTHDMHIWLDPMNAVAMTAAIVRALAGADPTHAALYEANGAALQDRLRGLDATLSRELAPVARIPYVVFHDAYQYFEARYALNAVGSIAVSTASAPGARRIRDIRAKIRASGARCVFSEPQFEPALVETAIEDTDARTGVLDPTGAALPAGPEAYFALLRDLSRSLRDCLAPTRWPHRTAQRVHPGRRLSPRNRPAIETL